MCSTGGKRTRNGNNGSILPVKIKKITLIFSHHNFSGTILSAKAFFSTDK